MMIVIIMIMTLMKTVKNLLCKVGITVHNFSHPLHGQDYWTCFSFCTYNVFFSIRVAFVLYCLRVQRGWGSIQLK